MMVDVRSILYSILNNGEPKGMIYPTRGICQSDPLSPFLFLLCTEGLHRFISHEAALGNLRGYSLCRSDIFVDDSLLFCFANQQEC